MLPKQLTIQGLYSYQEKQTIDFSRLTEAGIFGIFGAVGSGKSSILEAIGFALYGKTERLNEKENRNYNMMNLRSSELLIDFEFEHHDHTRYRFTVKGKRNGKRFHDVRTLERNAYKLENKAWIPLPSADAADVLDMSYDNFRRTIIIPQGKFQEFLQLGNSDRTRMMMDIFHLHKYDLSDKVRSLEIENELLIENIRGQLTTHANSSEEEILSKQAQLAETQTKEKELMSNIGKLKNALQESSKLKEQFHLLKQYKAHFRQLEQEKETFEKRQKALACFQQAKLYFEPSLLRKKTLELSIKNRENSLQASDARLEKINAEMEELALKWELLQKDYAHLDQWQQQIQELQTVQDILDYQQQAKDLQEKIFLGKKHIAKEEENKDQLTKTCNELEENIQSKKNNLPSNIFVFSEAGEWFQQNKAFQKQIESLQEQLATHQERTEKGKTLFSTLSFNYENWQEEAEHKKNQAKKTISDLQEKKNKISTKAALHQYAQKLQDGSPCPLCGATHHPNVLVDNATIKKEIQEVEQALTAHNQSLAILENNIAKATRYATEIKAFQEQAHILSKSLEQEKQALQRHRQHFHWKDFDAENEAGFIDKKQVAEKNLAETRQLEVQLSERKKQLDMSKETLGKYYNALSERLAQYDAAEKNAQILSDRLHLLDKDKTGQYTKAYYAQEKTVVENKITTTKIQHEALQKQLQELDRNKAIVTSEIQTVQLEKAKEISEEQTVRQHIEQLLRTHQIDTAQTVWDTLKQDMDIQKENTAIQQYQNQLFAAQQKLDQLQDVLKDKTFDETQWLQQQEELQTAKESLASHATLAAQLSQTVEALHLAIESKKQLEKQLHEKLLRKDNIQTLRNLFAGGGFVNFVSSVYLKNLCVAANERFSKLTHNQLHLELSENNEFLVRDFLNEGKTRSAKTLSGGQTFQASLSLALALADSIQYQNKSGQNFFFLDEGFGALDKEALSTIYETLQSLRKEHRIVGIISHVEDLQQEVPMSIFVENDAEKGSRIHLRMS